MVICLALGTVGRASASAEGFGTQGFGVSEDGEHQMLEKTVTCSDNKSYSIQVTYKNTSGIPMTGTELLVKEIHPGDAGYEAYLDASAAKVGVDSENIAFTRVFDIQIVSAEDHGVKYEPEGGVNVRITMNGSALAEYDKIDVLHFTEDQSMKADTVQNMNTEVSGETVAFTTESFSVYVIVAHEDEEPVTPRVEFHYISPIYSGNGGVYTAGAYCFPNQSFGAGQNEENVFWTQIVKDGETLTFVPTPADQNSSHFEGWYVVNCTSETVTALGKSGTYTYRWPRNPRRQTFNETVSVSMSGNTVSYTLNGETYSGTADSEGCLHVYLAPLYTNYRFIDFNDYDGNLAARKLLVLDSNGLSTISISDVTTVNPDSDHYFMGWSTVRSQSGEQAPANTFLIYEDGYIVDTYITLQENGDGTFAIYSGTEAEGTPKIASYASPNTNGDVILHAEFELAHWLRFVAGETGWGALYVPADYLVGTTPATALPTTARNGYTFSGWWTGWQDKTTGTIYYVHQVTDGNGNVLGSANETLINNDAEGSVSVNGTSATGAQASINARSTGTVSNGSLTMTDHSYLFAKWTPNNSAPYTVVIWDQKVTDSVDADYTPAQYEAWKAAFRNANPGATDEDISQAWAVSGHQLKSYDYRTSYVRTCNNTSQPAGSSASDRSSALTGFHLADAINGYLSYDPDAVIDPQGTTVFNVYYDRNKHTFTFQDHYQATNATNGTQYGVVNERYVQLTRNGNNYYASGSLYTGQRYTNLGNNSWAVCKTITALYGQSISSYFPILTDSGVRYVSERWKATTTAVYSEVLVLVDQMPDNDVTFRIDSSTNSVKTMNYYVEALSTDPASPTDTTRNGVRYKLYNSVSPNYGYVTVTEDFISIYGFVKNGSDPEPESNGRISGTPVNFYYLREQYNLEFNTNYPGGATFAESGSATTALTIIEDIPFDTLLSEYASMPSPNVPDHYVFDGWYEDRSGTTPFNFDDPNGIQGDKIVYAKWYPVYYLIQVDPAGGTMAGPDVTNQSTYFWLQYGTAIGRYDTVRDYIEVDVSDPEVAADMAANPQDYYYYRYVNFNQFEHASWSGYNEADLYYVDPSDAAAIDAEKDNEGIKPSFDRLAEYVSMADFRTASDTFYQYLSSHMVPTAEYTSAQLAEYWDNCYVNTGHIYRKIGAGDPTYTLVGWYSNGHPYDFSAAVTQPVTLTAVWRQSGKYRIRYSANMTEPVNGTLVFGDLTNTVYDPTENDEGYADGAEAVVGTAPENIRGGSGDENVYIFEGWRIVNQNGEPLDERGNVLTSGTGTLYQPGDTFTVLNTMTAAGSNNIIFFEAYYKNVADSSRRPKTVNLILDANAEFYGVMEQSANSNWAWVKPGAAVPDPDANRILFGDTQTNVSVHLNDYKDSFINTNRYFLLGFDEGSDIESAYNAGSAPDGLRSGSPFVASYATDSIIGIDLRDPYPNLLYAVWEPMVYATFVNETGADIVLTLSATGPNVLSVVNEVNGVYEREPVTGSVTVPAGGQIKLVLPYGENERITASAVNNHNGYQLSVSSTFAGNANESATQVIGDQNVFYGATAKISDKLRFDTVGIIVTYTEEMLPEVSFDVNGGTWTEPNTGDDSDTQYVHSTDNTAIYTINPIAIEELGGYEPQDPTRANHVFVGWTTYPAIAEHTVLSGTEEVTWGTGSDAVTITPDEGSNLYAKIKSDYLWDFTQPAPLGQTLYAVWSETVTVTFHLRATNANNSAVHTWTDNSGDYTQKNNYEWTIVIGKGDQGPAPSEPTPASSVTNATSFVYWIVNPTNPGTASYSYSNTVVDPDDIDEQYVFDFSQPVYENTILTTSWTSKSKIPVTITKRVSPVLDESESYTYTYTIRTYWYRANGNSTVQLSNPTEDTDQTVTETFTLTDGSSEIIPLYYWTETRSNYYYFYYQTLEVTEGDYTDTYVLTFDGLANAAGNAENRSVTVDVFTGKITQYRYQSSWGTTRRSFQYTDGSTSYYYRVGQNAWRTGYNNDTAANFPIQTAEATFVNTRITRPVTVMKVVEGDDITNAFSFTATVMYDGRIVTGYDENGFTDGVRTFTLAHNETIELQIPIGASLVVTETVPEGFTSEAASDDYEDADAEDGSFTIEEVNLDSGLIVFTNKQHLVAPTGVKTDLKPYLWMLLLGALLMGLILFGRWRKAEE